MGVWRRRRKKWCDITISKTEKYRFEKEEKERELSSGSGSADTELGSFFCLNTAAGAMAPLPATPEERPRMGSWPNIYSSQNSCFPRTGMSTLFHGVQRVSKFNATLNPTTVNMRNGTRSRWLLCSRVPTRADYESLSCQAYTHSVTFSNFLQPQKCILLGWGKAGSHFAVASLKFHI